MKKLLITGFLILVVLLGACTQGGEGKEAEDTLNQTVKTADGHFSIDVPDNWLKDYSYTDQDMIDMDMILNYTDNDMAYINIYFYDAELYDYPLNLVLKDNTEYYGDNIIGEYEEMSLDGMDAFVFEYSMVDLSVDEVKLNYHGYDYMINTPYGVVEIDIYYSQQVIESKIFKPTDVQLQLLSEIAESFKVLEAE